MAGSRHIAVVGGDAVERERVVALIRGAIGDRGAQIDSADHLELGGAPEVSPSPDIIVVCGTGAGAVIVACAEARQVPHLAETVLLAALPDGATDADAAGAIAAGATDAIIGELPPAQVATRLQQLGQLADARRRGAELVGSWQALVEAQELLVRGGDEPHALRAALLLAVGAMGFDRASLVAHIEGSDHAFVIAATDDPTLSQFALAVADYPEVERAILGGQPVLIADVTHDPLTARLAEQLAAAGVRAIAVFPVSWRGRPIGAVIFRRARPGVEHIDAGRAAFARLFAGAVGPHLRHGRVLESLRDQTHRISRARYEAERRLRTMDSLKDHFEAAADGVIVVDEHGHILFVNRTAEAITGFARDGLIGSDLAALVPPLQRTALVEVTQRVLAGQNLEPFDLDLASTGTAPICVSVSTSTVMSQSGAVILSFRDVSAQRALEIELRKTKDFLERLIDSTVDAIIAADLGGNVILFNQGAERLYGYRSDEVIGKLPVWELYDEGVPRQVMRMLRSTSYGGVGRLEQTRREIKAKSGERVPVNMTASIIYEEGREVATVGIFSDLRDRIRIEQRLLQAQERLARSEKHAVIAELAGAAAHELNQPLTSIIGYTQLVQRQSAKDAAHMRALGIILGEAERMAEIVRKIGRITKYETTEYVGSASILDLDKSASQSGHDLVLPDEDQTGEILAPPGRADHDDEQRRPGPRVDTEHGAGGRELGDLEPVDLEHEHQDHDDERTRVS